jgi:DNA repair exonuclease SbcCD ATPase subunit
MRELQAELAGLRATRDFLRTVDGKIAALERELGLRTREAAELRRLLVQKDGKIQALRQSCESKAALQEQIRTLHEQLDQERTDRRRAATMRAEVRPVPREW